MEENKIFNKESFLTVLISNEEDLIFGEYEPIEEDNDKKKEFNPQKINNQTSINQVVESLNIPSNQVANNKQVNVQQNNSILCKMCNGTFWSVSAYNLHWSCKKNLKCGYCCLYGHTISKCPSLNRPIKDIIE
jgi:hypothetical protein